MTYMAANEKQEKKRYMNKKNRKLIGNINTWQIFWQSSGESMPGVTEIISSIKHQIISSYSWKDHLLNVDLKSSMT